MAITPPRTFRLSKEDRKLLRELARLLKTSQAQAVRLAIRAAVAGLREKNKKQQAKRNEINE